MSKIYTFSIPFGKLERNFKDGIYAIPQLQRNYVWDANRVCLLFDSIFRHYPIGVSLVWRAGINKIAEIRPNNKTILPPFNVYSNKIDYIIDGQQRLTSLYGIINGIHEQKDFNSVIDFRKIYFSFDKNDEKRFVYLKRYKETDRKYIPLYDVLTENFTRLKNKFALSLYKIKEVLNLKKQFATYKFVFIYLETNSLQEVRETFIRINSQGMTVGKADTIFARTTDIGLRDLLDSTRRALMPKQFNEIKPEYFIYTLSLASGEKEVGKRALENFIKKFKKQKIFKAQFQKEWKKYHKAFLLAVDFLDHEFGITNYPLLPSDNIFTMISLFHYWNNGKPTITQKREIVKWFWHTTLGERYSGSAFSRNIKSDTEFFYKLARRTNFKYSISEKINPNDFLKKDYRKSNFSAVKGYYLFLKLNCPKYLQVGYQMKLENSVAVGNKTNKHHIFPRAVLNRKHIISKWNNSLLNICFLAASENQSISDNDPPSYLNTFKKYGFFYKVMKTHLIPIDSASGVWNKNIQLGFKSFLNQRGSMIINEISKIAKIKKHILFEKFEEIKRI